ncbi:uncharacterized protein [Populus alba]
MANDSNNNFIQPSIPRFDGHFDHWSMLMENFLRSKEFWILIEIGYTEPEEGASVTETQRKKLEELKLKDLKVKNYLFQAIDRTILETIPEKNTSKQIWDSMKRKYEGNARVKRSILQTLRKEFETLEMKTGEHVTDYFAKVMTVASKMRIYGEQMRDVTIVEKILRSLTDRFNYIVCSIEESKDIDVLSIDELQSSLIVHEQKFQKHSMEEQALKVTYEERSYGRGQSRRIFRGGGRVNKEANYAELNNEEEILLMSHVELYDSNREDSWFLDSGCSNHMCGDKNMFYELNEEFRQLVKLGNNTRMTVLGKGKVKLLLNGLQHTVTDVFYVPELKNNLLSIGQLQEKGMAILIKSGTCKVYHPMRGLIIQTRMTINRMFVLIAKAQLTTTYTPQQNGVAERKNRTMMNLVRSMLTEKKIPKSFWAEAVNWIIYVLNRCPTNAVKYMTPEEVWTGIKPSVEHFRVFGCVAHVHIPNARRTKLEDKSVCCILLGVSEESKGYKLYDPATKRIVTSRDIIFEEEKHWDWDISHKEELQMDLEWGGEGATDGENANISRNAEAIENNTTDSGAESVLNGIEGSSNAHINTIYEEGVNLNTRRETIMPSWMRDYVSGEGLSEEET